MDELGVPLFQETPIDRDVYTYVYIFYIFNHSLFLHEAHYNFAYSICLAYDRKIAQDSVALFNL